MQIRCFDEETVKKLFLSSYIEAMCDSSFIYLRNSMFMEPLSVRVDREYQTDFLRTLDRGCSISHAKELFQKYVWSVQTDEQAEWLLRQMMIRGILE